MLKARSKILGILGTFGILGIQRVTDKIRLLRYNDCTLLCEEPQLNNYPPNGECFSSLNLV